MCQNIVTFLNGHRNAGQDFCGSFRLLIPALLTVFLAPFPSAQPLDLCPAWLKLVLATSNLLPALTCPCRSSGPACLPARASCSRLPLWPKWRRWIYLRWVAQEPEHWGHGPVLSGSIVAAAAAAHLHMFLFPGWIRLRLLLCMTQCRRNSPLVGVNQASSSPPAFASACETWQAVFPVHFISGLYLGAGCRTKHTRSNLQGNGKFNC